VRAASLAGLAPAVILTAEHDVLRDEGEAYARRLAEHGVRVEHKRLDGQMHGFFTMVGLVPGSAAGLDFVARAIDRELGGRQFDAIVVGAGFAGLYALHRLREMGLSVRVFEQGDGVGGTWYWNRYPGVRCDIESVDYSYSFSDELEQEWEWSERYPAGPEILRYLSHVADRFDLRREIQLSTRITEADYDESSGSWQVVTEDGARISASYCVLASGCLSSVHRPPFEGLDEFAGGWYLEQHVDWIADCIGYLCEHGLEGIEAMPDAEDGWVAHVAEVAEATLFPLANSWYVGANIPGKPRVFMPYLGGVGNYRTHCDAVAGKGYEGFSVGRELAGARS
jgi:cyclohexanone monooxygenase